MEKRCSQCGSLLAPEAVFCGKCGTKVDGANGSAAHQKDMSRNSRTKIVIIGITALIVILGVVLAVVFGGNKDSTPEHGTTPPVQSNTENTDISDSNTNTVTVDFSKYIGKYKADTNEIELTVFDISKDGEVFFEIGLKDTWVISGVAFLEDNEAVFSLVDDYGTYQENSGTITLDADTVNVSISAMQVNFEENIGNYTLKRYANVDTNAPYSDEMIGIDDFGIFTSFIETQFGNSNPQWVYLGTTLGDFGRLSYENSGFNADLYRLTSGSENSYYAVYMANAMTGEEFGVCEIVDGKLSDFLFTKTLEVNSQPVQNMGYEAPYCPGDFSKIGETFSTFYVAGSGLQYSSNSLYILMVQEYPLIRNGWDAYTDYNGYSSRVGVANDRIVFNVQDLDSVSVAESLPADMLEVEPLIVCGTDDYGNIGELMLIWKGDNGYMVGFTTAYGYPNNSYQDEQVKFFISTVDLAYISNMPAEVIAANPAY